MRILAFDSGIGGLTALVPVLKSFPSCRVTYFGDLAHLPYGTKSPERIRRLSEAAARWLLASERVPEPASTWCLVACNTASAHALDIFESVAAPVGVKVSGVIVPGCRKALAISASRIVVLATSATVFSEVYPRKLREGGFRGEIVQKACPLFVPLVEDDLLSGPEVEGIVRRYLDGNLRPGDAVVLGCTHYPLLLPALQKLYPSATWIDAGHSLLETDPHPGLAVSLSEPSTPSSLKLVVTDDVGSAVRARRFLECMGLAGLDVQVEAIAPLV